MFDEDTRRCLDCGETLWSDDGSWCKVCDPAKPMPLEAFRYDADTWDLWADGRLIITMDEYLFGEFVLSQKAQGRDVVIWNGVRA
jgi:hypothetical protein